MTAVRALKLWLLCTVFLAPLWLMQGMQALLGSPARSINMACALDACGNALFGGDFRMTISERVGLAVLAGKRRNGGPEGQKKREPEACEAGGHAGAPVTDAPRASRMTSA